MTGRFITLEGGEGAGKSTQAKLLADALTGQGVDTALTREPGGAPGAEILRGLLLSGDIAWSPMAETFLHFSARAEHVAKTIRPALEAGRWVICDRFADSTMAYQGAGQGADRSAISMLTRMIGLRPDLTLVLDVSAPVARVRLNSRGGGADRYERLGEDFHARVADGFRAIAAAEPERCALINADADASAVHRAVMDAVRSRLGLSP